MIIYLTRHGQPDTARETEGPDPDYPPGDPPLSRLGEKQSRALGRRLRAEGFRGAIYASPYHRTARTADLIAAELGLCFHPEPAIREMVGNNILSFSGLDVEELGSLCPRLAPGASLLRPWWTTELEPADPETGRRRDIEKRVGEFLGTILSPEGGDVLLVGHGASAGAATRILYLARNRGEKAGPDRIAPIYNCGLNAFRLERKGIFELFQNDVSHLPPEEVTSNSRFLNAG